MGSPEMTSKAPKTSCNPLGSCHALHTRLIPDPSTQPIPDPSTRPIPDPSISPTFFSTPIMTTRLLSCILLALSLACLHAEQATPKIFAGLLKKDQPIKGQVGMVIPPNEIDKHVAKVAAASRKNPEWFKQFSEKSEPGVPLPFHENLGLTKEEYDDYLKLWKQREFKTSEEVMILLRQGDKKSWVITATGSASTLSTLRYHAASDSFQSPNGKLTRLEDIDAPADSILGAWKGREWRFQEETGLGTTKENIALGQSADGKHGMIVYRVQELTGTGTRLLDKSLVVRFQTNIQAN